MDDFWSDGFRLNFDEDEFYPDQLKVALADAMVMSIFFMRVGSSLILDLRTAEGISPAVLIDSMTPSPRERLLSFRHLRPQLPIPDEITLAPWAERVADFEREGVLARLLERCDEVGGGELIAMARTAYLKMLAEERKILRDIVTGAGMETIWERR
ncbi:MAG TPA: hypothetical protein VFP05_15555 [Thermomicrobiales bacterium]|jgi:hypothetical protein|nr:hypothetical protein [Thermomicrobiales bacterium]